MSQGQTGFVKRDKPRFSPYFTVEAQFVPGTNPVCPWDNPEDEGRIKKFMFHARYDWTTGVPDDGNVWRKYRVVPRAYPSHPLICANFHRVGKQRAF